MKLNNKKVLYLSFHRADSKGVTNKISGIIKELRNKGYQVEYINPGNCKSINSYIKETTIILKTDAKYIIIRSLNTSNIFLTIIFFIARLQRRFLLIDVPTPMKAYIHELKKQNIKGIKKWIYIILCYVHGPWIFWFFNKVIQYGSEGAYFKIGNKSRFLTMGNGIDVNSIRIREKKYRWPSNEIIMVGVAQVRFYHGYDRIIKAINYWNKYEKESKINFKFHIIGGGDETCLDDLKKLVKEYHLCEFVFFHGPQTFEYIYKYYSISHIAVSTLGLYRIKLKDASVLKAREYCAAGIPFIATGEDPDFDDDTFFRFTISNDNSIDDIIDLFRVLPLKIENFDPEKIRNFALNNLTFQVKLSQMGF